MSQRGYLAQQRHRVQVSCWQLAAIALGLPLLVALASLDTVENLLRGPFVMDAAGLSRVKAPPGRGRPPRHFVRVQTGALTVFSATPVRSGADRDDGRLLYHALTEVEGQPLVVTYSTDGDDDRDEAPTPGGRVWRTGNLEPLQGWVRERLLAGRPDLAAALLPVVLHTGTRYQGGITVLAVLLGLLTLAGAWAVAVGLRARLATRWPAAVPGDLLALVDEEAADPEAIAAGQALLTRSFLLCPRTFGLDVVPVTDLVPGAERFEHQERYLMVLPGRSQHWLVLRTRQGRRLSLDVRRYGADRFLEALERRTGGRRPPAG